MVTEQSAVPDGDDTRRIELEAADEGTHLSVLDGTLTEVAAGWRRLTYDARPGLYKVVRYCGFTVEEELLKVESRGPAIRRSYSRLPIDSPAPLTGSHRPPAETIPLDTLTVEVHARVGRGSSVFVFWRGPITELLLCDRWGKTVADLGESAVGPSSGGDGMEWWACNAEVDPSLYRLSQKYEQGERIEQTVVAAAGYQTQIFLQNSTGRGWKLGGAAIFYSGERRFDPDAEEVRLSELLRIGLVTRRQTVSDLAWREAFDGSFGDPMMVLYAIALSLVVPPPEWMNDDLRADALELLARGWVPGPPDVNALRLPEEQFAPIDFPPMLRLSWDLLVRASARKSELLDREGLAIKVAKRLLAGEPWLLWNSSVPRDGVGEASARGGRLEDRDPFTLVFSVLLRRRGAKGRAAAARPVFKDEEWETFVSALNLPRSGIEQMIELFFPSSGPEYWRQVRAIYSSRRPDRERLAGLIGAEHTRVFHYACHNGLPPEDAQEVGREHCMRLLRRLKDYDPSQPIEVAFNSD